MVLEKRLSREYYVRKEMMANLTVPTLSQAKFHSGLPLSLVIFEETPKDLRSDFGLEPRLEGHKGDLWVSPSDLLIGKVVLKPPLTQKHIQALTHEGILKIGREIEQKFVDEMTNDKYLALDAREDYLNKVFAIQKEELIKEITKKAEEKTQKELNDLRSMYDDRMCELLWECAEQVKELEEQMQIECDSLNVLWKEYMDQEIQETVRKLTEHFLEKMRLQEKILVGVFNKKIENLKNEKKCAIDFERLKCKELLLQMRHKLHCENITNLMYMLCKERQKCKLEEMAIKKDYSSRIKQLKKRINKQSGIIKKLTCTKDRQLQQLKVRERCLIEILKQFQKFIYYALKATPTQGEFLLNVEKLIKYELEDFCLRESEKQDADDINIVEPVPVVDLQEKYFEKSPSKSSSSQLEESQNQYDDVLPAFYFNNKLYIREEFRDILETQLEGEGNFPLWNPEVEELIKIFKETIKPEREADDLDRCKSVLSSVHFSHPNSPSVGSSFSSSELIASIANMSSSQPESPALSKHIEMQIQPSSKVQKTAKIPDKKSRTSQGADSLKSNEFGIRNANPAAILTQQSRLTLARDSIILTITSMEHKSMHQVIKTAEETLSKAGSEKEKTLSLKTSDTQLKTNESLRSEEILTESEGSSTIGSQESLTGNAKEPTSRLYMANDSYEIIKSTIALVKDKEPEPEMPPPDTERKKSITINPYAVVDIQKITQPKKVPKKGKTIKQDRTKKKCICLRGTPILTTPRSTAKVVGSSKMMEYKKEPEEFTEERIKSLVNIMKENPSLMRLFTACHQ